MNSDHSNVNGGGAAAPGAADANRPKARCYMAVTPLLEVLEDQLRFLIDHAARQCLPGCADCARLEEAKQCLLRPFA